MLLWTDGEAAVIATGRGVARISTEGEELCRFDDERSIRRDEPPPPEFFAMLDAAGRHAVLGREGVMYQWTSADGAGVLRELGPGPRTAVALGDGRLVVAVPDPHPDGRERTVLAVATLDAKGGLVRERTLVLPEAVRARGDLGLWPKVKVPWPEDEDGASGDGLDVRALDVKHGKTAWQGEVRLHVNRHGLVATSTYSGMVVGFDPRTLAPAWAFRVPTQAEQAIHAVALDGGALVVVCIEGRHAAVLRCDREGAVKAQRAKLGRDLAWGLRAPLLVDADTAVVCNALTGTQVHELTLSELAAKRVTTSPFGGDVGLVAHTSTADGETHVVAIGDPEAPPHKQTLHRLVRTGGRMRATPMAMPDLRPPERAMPVGPARHGGPASVGITAGSGVWTCAPDAEVDLNLSVTSKGGPAPGLWIELSGPAIDAGLFEAVAAVAGELTAQFVRKGATVRADLAGPALEPAYIRATGGHRVPKGEPPDPVSTVAIRVRGLKTGSALLMVRIGPAGSDGATGSAMNGRTISVAIPSAAIPPAE